MTAPGKRGIEALRRAWLAHYYVMAATAKMGDEGPRRGIEAWGAPGWHHALAADQAQRRAQPHDGAVARRATYAVPCVGPQRGQCEVGSHPGSTATTGTWQWNKRTQPLVAAGGWQRTQHAQARHAVHASLMSGE